MVAAVSTAGRLVFSGEGFGLEADGTTFKPFRLNFFLRKLWSMNACLRYCGLSPRNC